MSSENTRQFTHVLIRVIVAVLRSFNKNRKKSRLLFDVRIHDSDWSMGWQETNSVWLVRSWLIAHNMYSACDTLETAVGTCAQSHLCFVKCKNDYIALSMRSEGSDWSTDHLEIGYTHSQKNVEQFIEHYLSRHLPIQNDLTTTGTASHVSMVCCEENRYERLHEHVVRALTHTEERLVRSELMEIWDYRNMHFQRLAIELSHDLSILVRHSLQQALPGFTRWMTSLRASGVLYMVDHPNDEIFKRKSVFEEAMCHYPKFWTVHRLSSCAAEDTPWMHSSVVFTSFDAFISIWNTQCKTQDGRHVFDSWNCGLYIDNGTELQHIRQHEQTLQQMSWIACSDLATCDYLTHYNTTEGDNYPPKVFWLPPRYRITTTKHVPYIRSDIDRNETAPDKDCFYFTCQSPAASKSAHTIPTNKYVREAHDGEESIYNIISGSLTLDDRYTASASAVTVYLAFTLDPVWCILNRHRGLFAWSEQEAYSQMMYNENVWAREMLVSHRDELEAERRACCMTELMVQINNIDLRAR